MHSLLLLLITFLCHHLQAMEFSPLISDDWRNDVKIYGNDCKYSMMEISPTLIVSPFCQLSFHIPQTKFIQYTRYHLQRMNYEKYMLFRLKFHIQKFANLSGAVRVTTFLEDGKQFSLDFDSNNATSVIGEFNLPWVALLDLDNTYNVHLALLIEPLEITNVTKEELNFIEITDITVEYVHQPERMELQKKMFVLEPLKESNILPAELQTCNWTDPTIQSNCNLLGNPHSNALNGLHISKIRHIENESSASRDLIVGSRRKTPKVFCGIFTTADKHPTKVKATRNTWASKCTSFLAFSTFTDPDIPSISLPHIGHESYRNMWQKSRAIWNFIALHYVEEFDWFLLGGDDMYYLMENLYEYLSSDEIMTAHSIHQEALYLGRKFLFSPMSVYYNTGGPGYLLNSHAVKKLGMLLNDQQNCPIHDITPAEDVYIGRCFAKHDPPILPYDTRDAQHTQRFHYFSPGFLYDPEIDASSVEYQAVVDSDSTLTFGNRSMEGIISKESISFHFIEEELMYSMHEYLYECPRQCKAEFVKQFGVDYYDENEQQKIISVSKGARYRRD